MRASLRPRFVRLRNVLDRWSGKEVALKGGMSSARVVRVGDTVRRPMNAKSAFVHDVLRHLERREFDRAPRFLGIDEKGRATLTYISGTVPRQLGGFQKEQWRAAARLLRPNSLKWAVIKAWAQACLAWTYRHRKRIAAGIVMRSEFRENVTAGATACTMLR